MGACVVYMSSISLNGLFNICIAGWLSKKYFPCQKILCCMQFNMYPHFHNFQNLLCISLNIIFIVYTYDSILQNFTSNRCYGNDDPNIDCPGALQNPTGRIVLLEQVSDLPNLFKHLNPV